MSGQLPDLGLPCAITDEHQIKKPGAELLLLGRAGVSIFRIDTQDIYQGEDRHRNYLITVCRAYDSGTTCRVFREHAD
ncbi:hypothetical protein SAMN05216308_104150 [Nitrosospira sp. Nsp13]|nr:hypothetical protein SAMN05216308_104150 [Nitrosospira sp. Nsp13]